ncbi:MAG: hypothetical protein HZY79_15150 [Rhodoblastus sp.]|nr:MAG: hypothetical protein HZY79_15150 [Rhodoblastus sp.]
MPFDPRRAEASAREPVRASAQDPRAVMRAFLETLARLAAQALSREAAR